MKRYKTYSKQYQNYDRGLTAGLCDVDNLEEPGSTYSYNLQYGAVRLFSMHCEEQMK